MSEPDRAERLAMLADLELWLVGVAQGDERTADWANDPSIKERILQRAAGIRQKADVVKWAIEELSG